MRKIRTASKPKQSTQKDKHPKLPPGYVRCAVCGEYNGTTDAQNLSWGDYPPEDDDDDEVSVTCVCYGIPCKQCGKLRHRPSSNEYDPITNEVWHTSFLVFFSPYCQECRESKAAERSAQETAKSKSKRNKANQKRTK